MATKLTWTSKGTVGIKTSRVNWDIGSELVNYGLSVGQLSVGQLNLIPADMEFILP